MGTYVFLGSLLPAVDSKTVSVVLRSLHQDYDDGVTFDMDLDINGGYLAAQVRASGVDVETLRNHVAISIEQFVDAASYMRGVALTVDLHAVIEPDGKLATIGSQIKGLSALDHDMDSLLAVLTRPQPNPHTAYHLGRAIANVREAIRSPWDTGLFAYRAVESVRQLFVDKADSKKTREKKSWERLRNALKVERGWFDDLLDWGEPQRHSEPMHMSGDERLRAIGMARMVISRFVAYASGGLQPLDEASFPALIGGTGGGAP